MQILSGEYMFINNNHAQYRLLRHLEPGLCLDIGAAAGHMTKAMLAAQPSGTVIGFEPFPGNHQFFFNSVGSNPQATLRKTAVSDSVGKQRFTCSSVITSGTGAWANMEGYSSVGKLLDDSEDGDDNGFEVDVTTVDNEIGSSHVRFMKIDVQGFEKEVLAGSKQALSEERVDLIFAEYDGDIGIFELMMEYDYTVYDNEYALFPRQGPLDLEGWKLIREVDLSTGKRAFNAWPHARPNNYVDYNKWFLEQRRRYANINTDLLFCSRKFAKKFQDGVRALNAKGG